MEFRTMPHYRQGDSCELDQSSLAIPKRDEVYREVAAIFYLTIGWPAQ